MLNSYDYNAPVEYSLKLEAIMHPRTVCVGALVEHARF